ncbi:3-ketoacyl-CoA thiolase [Burkholderia sp. YR290]|uniref:acetyl-CoA C-acetyltransferase n=1 Tax=Paraburkholderia hospita TaxID=169430 RepID=UPI0009A6E925|nr:acetyl-CoA C-acetyltransferase [Paraburkholderia hospita]SKC70349.1 3-ketoacyl-CoA thiolase [Paraburkholderia hospita]SOE67983.1 3-ketoacyl-CoA thiolase [Burkholderia sp. YR290]
MPDSSHPFLQALPTARRVAILGGNRIPFARSNTAYATASNQDMLTFTLQGLIDRYNLHGERLGEVAAGAVIKHSRDYNLTREAVLSTTLAKETPAYDVQQACGTGLEAAILVANKIALGQIDAGIAGGADTTSDAPIGVNERMRKILLEANRGKSAGQRVGALAKLRPGMFFKPLLPSNSEPRTGLSMGEHCELMAKRWGISREAQDVLAYDSHRKLTEAYARGFLNDLMTPFRGLARDNNLRSDLTLDKLATLKPVFDRDAGTMTAGNSTPLTDGASAVLLASEEWATARGLPVLAWLTWHETAAVDFFEKKEGLLMAPAYAVPRMLKRAGLTLQDFDFYEIHEAFAAQVLCTLAAWQDDEYCRTQLRLEGALGTIDRAKMNVNGGSLATGHPFAATGGRIVAGLAKMLAQLDKPAATARGLISICAAGGQGVVAILER